MENGISNPEKNQWLPTSKKEMEARGWEFADVILFTGDAYIDHPAFGAAVIGRVIESKGLKVAIVPQPNWRDDLRDFKKLGRPRLFFAVTSGNMDSMVNHYTAGKRLRSDDAFTAGGKAGFRPDYCIDTYCRILKNIFPDIPVVIGGIEASMRRLAHYDYWSDGILPSILVSSGADLLIYGMAEKPLIQFIDKIIHGADIKSIYDIPQTAYIIQGKKAPVTNWNDIMLNSFAEVKKDKLKYAYNFTVFETESNKISAARLIEPYDERLVVVNPAYEPLSTTEIDNIYSLPYTRLPHPRYKNKPIPAFDMIKNSITIHRGCFGGCSFCAISAHQGKFIASRSEESILNEIKKIASAESFNGTITDLGGPSANMYKMKGKNSNLCKSCQKPSCIFPVICKNLHVDHKPLVELYKKASVIKRIKHIFIGSGIRYDLFFSPDQQITDDGKNYLQNLIINHTSGRLKVAPEHIASHLLDIMRKPNYQYFKSFKLAFDKINRENHLNYQLIPYFISSHPGCTIKDMADLAVETMQMKYKPEQIQDFTPTPMTLSTAIYYLGFDPFTHKKIYTAVSPEEKKAQKTLFFWYKPELKAEISAILKQHKLFHYAEKLFNTRNNIRKNAKK